MIVLLLLVVLAAAIAVAGFVGATALTRATSGGAATTLAIPAAVVLAVVVLLVVMVTGVVGGRAVVGRGSPEAETGPADATTAATTVSPATPASAVLDAVVTVRAQGNGLRPPPVTAGVEAGDVVDVRGAGFSPHAAGFVFQCDRGACTNRFPVQSDEDGRVRLPYRLVAPAGAASTATLRIDIDGRRATSALAFGRVSQPARTVVRRLDDDRAEVDITGAPPSVALAAHACPRAARSLADCDDLDVDGSTTTAADGSATFVATRAAGDRRLVLSSGSVVVAEPVLLAARRGGTLVHDGRGIAAGFAIAGIFLALAVWLVRTTDWRVPAEAATPFLDAASLGPDR